MRPASVYGAHQSTIASFAALFAVLGVYWSFECAFAKVVSTVEGAIARHAIKKSVGVRDQPLACHPDARSIARSHRQVCGNLVSRHVVSEHPSRGAVLLVSRTVPEAKKIVFTPWMFVITRDDRCLRI